VKRDRQKTKVESLDEKIPKDYYKNQNKKIMARLHGRWKNNALERKRKT
jgi:hypothetical protein